MRIRSRGLSTLALSRWAASGLAISFLCSSNAFISFLNLALFGTVAINLVLSGFAERHPKLAQQLAGLVVAGRGGHKRNVHALDEVHLVRVDLGEHPLLGQPQRVVAVAVEALGVDPAEVADTRQGDRDQPVEELVHPPAAERHAAADLVADAEAEAGDGLLGPADLRPLPGDLGQVLRRLGHAVLVLQRLADTHVDDDLLQPRQAEPVGAAELLAQPLDDLVVVAVHQPSHTDLGSMIKRHPIAAISPRVTSPFSRTPAGACSAGG